MSISNNIETIQTTNLEKTTSLEGFSDVETKSNKVEKDTSVDRSKIQNLIDTSKKEDVPPPSTSSLEKANELTHDLEQNDLITQLSGKETKELQITELPPETEKLLEASYELEHQYFQANTVKEKLSFLSAIRTQFDALTEALQTLDPKSKAEPLLTDKLTESVFVLVDMNESISAIQKLKNEIRELRDILEGIKTDLTDPSAYTELHECITQCNELTEKDRSDLLKSVNKALEEKIGNELKTDPAVHELLAKGLHGPEESQVISSAATILARIRIENPYLQDKIDFKALFESFSNSRTPQEHPYIKGASDEDRLVSDFAQSLCVLAAIADPATDIDALTFCTFIDRFAGQRLEHFAVLGGLLKASLAPTQEIRTLALAQQEFEVSLKTLLAQLPKKALTQLGGSIQSIEALSIGKLQVLTQLPNFQDIANHVASLVLLQSELIRHGAINLVKVVEGDPSYDTKALFPQDPIELQNLRDEIAFKQIMQFSAEVDDADIDTLVKACVKEPLFKKGSTTELSPMHQMLMNHLSEMREDYIKRSIQGEKDESNISTTLQKASNKLTGTYFSENYLQKLYDLNINTKTARVFDGVFRELTGILDPKKRNIIKPENYDILWHLGHETANTLEWAIKKDSVSLLKKGVDEKEAAKTFEELIFNREAAKANGFNFEQLDKDTKEVLKEQSEAYKALRGTRRRIINSLKHEKDFALQNSEAVRLHQEKKAINAIVKGHKANADKVFTCFWHWKDRAANVEKILRLATLKDDLDKLQKLDPSALAPEDEQRRVTLTHDVEELYSELKDLNLANLVKHNSKEELSLEDFLEQALPLAQAIDYLRIKKTVKTDTARIKALVKQRNEARDKVDAYLKEAKKAYGAEVVQQIQRAVVMATYFVNKDHGADPLDFETRTQATFDFLKKNLPTMKHCDEGILSLLVRDTMRRFTPPTGPMSHKYLDRIEKELGTANRSLRVKFEKGLLTEYEIDKYKTSATRMYQERGAEGLMSMIDTAGNGFIYSKKTAFTLSSMPALMQASLAYMPSESFCVENTGTGYRVLVKSDHAVKIALSAGFRFPHNGAVKNLAAINVGVNAKATAKLGGGLELKFKNATATAAFIKDFMNPGSPLHTGEQYNPSWHTSEDIRILKDRAISGGIDASAKAAIRTFIGNNTYSNQLHFGSNQDFTKVKNLTDYYAMLNPTTSGNPVSNISVKLPSIKLGFDFSGGYTSSESINRNTISKRTSRKMRIEANLDVTQFQLTHTFKPLYKAIWTPLGKLMEVKPDNLMGMIMKALENTELEGAKKTLVEDCFRKALEAAKRGETDEANTQIGNVFQYLSGPMLDEFIALPTKNKHLHNVQNLMKIFAFEHKASHIGIFKAGTKQSGLTTNDAKVTVGVNLDVGPLGITGQAIGNIISNVSANADLIGHSDAKGKVSKVENQPEKTFIERATPYVVKAGTYASTIHNILMGDPTLAAANIIGMTLGDHTFDEKGKTTTKSVSINGKDIVNASIERRGKHFEGQAKASLREGISLKGGYNFFGTCDTENVDVYDYVKHQHLAETGIDYKITKSQFSLENLLEMLHLPEKIAHELQENKPLMKSILEAFVCAGPNDTFTLKTQINPKVLKEINRLELQTSLEPKNAKVLNQRIQDLLENPDNYTPVDLSISHNDVRQLRLAFEMSDISLGIFSFSHHRELTNLSKTSISLRALESVQEQFGAPPQETSEQQASITQNRMSTPPDSSVEQKEEQPPEKTRENLTHTEPTSTQQAETKTHQNTGIDSKAPKTDEKSIDTTRVTSNTTDAKKEEVQSTFDTSKFAEGPDSTKEEDVDASPKNVETTKTSEHKDAEISPENLIDTRMEVKQENTQPLQSQSQIQTQSVQVDQGDFAQSLPNPPINLNNLQSWRDFSSGLQAFINTHRTTIFGENDEAREALLSKVKIYGTSPDSFVRELALSPNKESTYAVLVNKYQELVETTHLNNEFEQIHVDALDLFENQAIPPALTNQGNPHEIEDYQSRVRYRLQDRDNYKEWMHAEPNAQRTPEAYLKWTATGSLNKLLLERNVHKFTQGAFTPTTQYPSATNPVVVGQTFSQHTNTCFLMAVANALSATPQGTALLNQWIQSNPSIAPELRDPDFDKFEQQFATLYKNFVNVNGTNPSLWQHLGEMGEADAVGLALGMDTLAGTQGFDNRSEPWQLRELWYDVSRALSQKKIVTLFTPGHYRAIVGTYGDPRTGDFGFVIRDSNKSGSNKQYQSSLNELASSSSLRRICIQTLPDPSLVEPWKTSRALPQKPPVNPESSSVSSLTDKTGTTSNQSNDKTTDTKAPEKNQGTTLETNQDAQTNIKLDSEKTHSTDNSRLQQTQAETKASQEENPKSLERVGLVKEIVDAYGETVFALIEDTYRSTLSAGTTPDAMRPALMDAAKALAEEVKAYDSRIESFLTSHPTWAGEKATLVRTAMQEALRQNPEFLDGGSRAYLDALNLFTNIFEGRNGMNEVISHVKDPADRQSFIQMLLCYCNASSLDDSIQGLILSKLPEMKASGKGAITPEIFFKTVFGTAVPDSFKNAGYIERQRLVNDQITQAIEKHITDAGCDDKNSLFVKFDLMSFCSAGVPYEAAFNRAVELAKNPKSHIEFDLKSINYDGELNFPPERYTHEGGIEQFFTTDVTKSSDQINPKTEAQKYELSGMDFQRMRLPDLNDLPRYSTFTVTQPNGESSTCTNRINQPEDLHGIERGLYEQIIKLCPDKEQQRLVFWTLSQSSPVQVATRTLSKYLGTAITMHEHMPLNVTIAPAKNSKDVIVTLDLPRGFGIEVGATYRIKTDGTSEVTRFEFRDSPEAKLAPEAALKAEFPSSFADIEKTHGAFIADLVARTTMRTGKANPTLLGIQSDTSLKASASGLSKLVQRLGIDEVIKLHSDWDTGMQSNYRKAIEICLSEHSELLQAETKEINVLHAVGERFVKAASIDSVAVLKELEIQMSQKAK